MLVAAALCPAAPALVTELTQGAADELADIREACDVAALEVLQRRGSRLIVVAAGAQCRTFDPRSPAGFARLGVALDVAPSGGPVIVGDPLPTPLAVGRWLLARAGRTVDDTWCTVDAAGARAFGERIAHSPEPVTLLVLGEACAAVGPHAPLPQDDRAPGFDAAVTDAVARGDVGALAALDGGLASALGATGWAPWQALAASAGGRPVAGRLLAYGAPYGVGYLVATWAAA